MIDRFSCLVDWDCIPPVCFVAASCLRSNIGHLVKILLKVGYTLLEKVVNVFFSGHWISISSVYDCISGFLAWTCCSEFGSLGMRQVYSDYWAFIWLAAPVTVFFTFSIRGVSVARYHSLWKMSLHASHEKLTKVGLANLIWNWYFKVFILSLKVWRNKW